MHLKDYTETDELNMEFIRARIDEINDGLPAQFEGKENVIYLDIHDKFLDGEGNLLKSVMQPDLQYLNAQGYEIWATAIAPLVEEIMGDFPTRHRANTPVDRNNAYHQQDLADKADMD